MVVFFVFAVLFAGFLAFGFLHGYRQWQDHRIHKRAAEKWQERQRVRSRMRLIQGGKSQKPETDDGSPS